MGPRGQPSTLHEAVLGYAAEGWRSEVSQSCGTVAERVIPSSVTIKNSAWVNPARALLTLRTCLCEELLLLLLLLLHQLTCDQAQVRLITMTTRGVGTRCQTKTIYAFIILVQTTVHRTATCDSAVELWLYTWCIEVLYSPHHFFYPHLTPRLDVVNDSFLFCFYN